MKKVCVFAVLLSFFSFASISSATLVNVALNGTATQSSLWTGASGGTSLPGNAIDGNTGGIWNTDFLTHTNKDNLAWWQVDLGSVKAIESIDVWNRTDSNADRLFPFTVSILDAAGSSLWSEDYNTAGLAQMTFDPANIINGQIVKIQLRDTNYLHLAEVQVWEDDGSQTPVPEPATFILLGSGLAGLAFYRRKRK